MSILIRDLGGLRNEMVDLDLFVTSNRFEDNVTKVKNSPAKSLWMYLGFRAKDRTNDAVFILFRFE